MNSVLLMRLTKLDILCIRHAVFCLRRKNAIPAQLLGRRATHLATGVLQSNVASVGGALADADRALGAALVRRLGAHLSLHHLADFKRGICTMRRQER